MVQCPTALSVILKASEPFNSPQRLSPNVSLQKHYLVQLTVQVMRIHEMITKTMSWLLIRRFFSFTLEQFSNEYRK